MNLIVGATGSLGGVIATRLLERGSGVRALVREGSDFSDLNAAGADLVFGDLKDRASLTSACQGVSRIVATATAAHRGGADTTDTVDRIGYQNLVKTAEESDVGQFIFVSGHGFALDAGPGLSRAKAETEAALRSSELNFTILRPAFFMEAWISMVLGAQIQNGRRVVIVGDPDRPYGFVAARNVADLALATLGHSAANRSTIAWSAQSASFRQIVEWIELAIGDPLVIESIKPGEAVPGLPPIVNELWAYAATGGMEPIATPDIAQQFNIRMVTPEEYVQQAFSRL